MSAVVKGVAGVGIPAVGVGGAYLYLTQSSQNMPEWKSLKSANNDKFGKDFQPYLVDHNEESNRGWWEWSYKERYKKVSSSDLSSDFGNLDSPDKLKEKCKSNYEESTSTLIPTTEDAEKTKRVNDIWKFCSPLGAKPKTIEESSKTDKEDEKALGTNGAYKGKLGESKKSDLISVNYAGLENEEFWKIKEKLFFGENGIGKHSKSSDKRNIFDKFHDEGDKRTKTLKDKCGEAYGEEKNKTQEEDVKEADVLKYCGLKVVAQ